MSLLSGFVVYQLIQRQYKKIAVADAVKLFDQFNLKKELETKEKGKLESINRQVDSIGRLLQLAQATRNADTVKRLSYAYGYMKAELESEYKKGNHDINEQVWKRLNPAVDEYGRAHKLHLIIGANGMGSVLYNDDYYDITPDLIKYVNKKYEEGN